MSQNKKKKITLVGSNPNDFLDCTLETIDSMINACCIVISKKFEKTFFSFFKENSIKYILEEDLSAKKGQYLWNKILERFSIYESLVHLTPGDTYLFSDCKDEKKFFEKNNILVERLSGIIGIVNLLNSKKIFLTDRKKNSSVTFLNKSYKKKPTSFLRTGNFEKLIYRIERKKQIEELIFAIKKKLPKRKSKLLIGKRIFNLNIAILKKISKQKTIDANIFVIIE